MAKYALFFASLLMIFSAACANESQTDGQQTVEASDLPTSLVENPERPMVMMT